MAKQRGTYRYQSIESRIWHDETFCQLSRLSRELFLYLLTGPQSNMLGLYVLQPGTVTDDLRCEYEPMPKWFIEMCGKGCTNPCEGVTQTPSESIWPAFAELISHDLIMYDTVMKIVFVKNYLRYNMIANGNMAKAAVALLRQLPETDLKDDFFEIADSISDGAAATIRQLFLEQTGDQQAGKGLPKPLRRGYLNKKKEKEKKNSELADENFDPAVEYAVGENPDNFCLE